MTELHLRQMTTADLPEVFDLKSEAGWNQTQSDLQRFLELQPDGCFVGLRDKEIVGTAAGFAFGSVGWVAMILVRKSCRGSGYGTALTKQAIDFLEERGAESIRLDATPLGEPIYRKLGFEREYLLNRFAGRVKKATSETKVQQVRPFKESDREAVYELDEQATDTPRRKLLDRLLAESPTSFVRDAKSTGSSGGELKGYVTTRAGSRATMLGPGIAATPNEAVDLLSTCLGAMEPDQSIYVDIPQPHPAATEWAHRQGFEVQRELTRMCRGPFRAEDPRQLFASSGPEKG